LACRWLNSFPPVKLPPRDPARQPLRFAGADSLPVMEFRQRKTLSVYLATPPWDLKGAKPLC
jgi:hypothetical protein